ncbi:MAG: FAD-dependent oxidoreductase, partial [bacterium]
FYNAIGTEVTLLEMMPQILPLEDAEVVEILAKSLKKSGIKIETDARISRVDKTPSSVSVKGNTVKGEQSWDADLCLVAVGVQANSDGMGLEEIGVQTEKGFVKINEQYCTNIPSIFAIGDLIGTPMLAHAASHEGITAVEAMAGLSVHKVDPYSIPSCTYCQPQIASIGLTEAKALERGYNLKIGRFPYSASGKALASGEREGLVKLIFDQKYGELIGAHIVGMDATEMIAELGLAKSHEAVADSIAATVHAHPTLSETIMEAALAAMGRAVHI